MKRIFKINGEKFSILNKFSKEEETINGYAKYEIYRLDRTAGAWIVEGDCDTIQQGYDKMKAKFGNVSHET